MNHIQSYVILAKAIGCRPSTDTRILVVKPGYATIILLCKRNTGYGLDTFRPSFRDGLP